MGDYTSRLRARQSTTARPRRVYPTLLLALALLAGLLRRTPGDGSPNRDPGRGRRAQRSVPRCLGIDRPAGPGLGRRRAGRAGSRQPTRLHCADSGRHHPHHARARAVRSRSRIRCPSNARRSATRRCQKARRACFSPASTASRRPPIASSKKKASRSRDGGEDDRAQGAHP